MRRVLLTGMSGTGKSTLISALAERGYKAIDLDTAEWSHWVPLDDSADPDGTTAHSATVWETHDWVWREHQVQRLLATEDADLLFVSGTSPNQGKFHPQFDHIILLSAPVEVLVERLSTRNSNTYGKDPAELARVLEHVQTVEPRLRQSALAEVDTSAPLDQVVATILEIVRP